MTNILYTPEPIKETLFYLDYIGGITDGKKLFIKEHTYVGDTDYLLRYSRYMEGESVETQMPFFVKLFNSYVKLKNSYDGIFERELNSSFKNFHTGMCVLSLTYQTNSKLNKFCEKLNDYRKMKFSKPQ
jgi:hypothetical protein